MALPPPDPSGANRLTYCSLADSMPRPLLTRLARAYTEGVNRAVANFPAGSADEDALSGAMSQAIRDRFLVSGAQSKLGFVEYPGRATPYRLTASIDKIRGRGPKAPENTYGSDGVILVQVKDAAGAILFSKGLPYQAKKEWEGTNKDLLDQVKTMETVEHNGIVIDYRRSGYMACAASDVVESGGNRKTVKGLRPLGDLLKTDFLACKLGTIGLTYDQATEKFTRLAPSSHTLTFLTTTAQLLTP